MLTTSTRREPRTQNKPKEMLYQDYNNEVGKYFMTFHTTHYNTNGRNFPVKKNRQRGFAVHNSQIPIEGENTLIN